MLISHLCDAAFQAWQFSSVFLMFAGIFKWRKPGVAVSVRTELHPFRWALVAGQYVPIAMARQFVTGDYIGLGFSLLNCWLFRRDDSDDDRWKRRKRKLTEQVTEVGGRLQVVPQGAA